ncbi:putative type VI secretion system effector [Chromobacterium sp. Panama]|uniref:putative type VI secretion system effector n=1 Tax=Chromobacterium sp. Panama TaxID=2161826 RepID=UPI0011B1FC4D|nr:putative type VI secretion system effector [Chromobacterium sp. Panama]
MHTDNLETITAPLKLEKISGTISYYKKSREMANFFFTDRDRNIMGLSAIAGALAGAAGMAASTARDASNLREQADYIEMKINGLPAKGWVWFSPFKDGDRVELIGIKKESHFEIIAIARAKDHVIALYPHCSRGKKAHIRTVIKWWLISSSFSVGLLIPLVAIIFDFISGSKAPYLFMEAGYIYAALAIYGILGAYSLSMGKRFMMYVHAATHVFKTMGLSDPDNIDLPKRTKRKPGDPGAFGVMYFNY